MKLNENLFKTINSILFKYKEYLLVGLIIFLAFSIRMGILMHTVDFHGVSNGKILEAQMILNDLDLKFLAPVHPPVHMLFLIIGMKLFGAFAYVSRGISLGFGIMTIGILYLYIKLIFDREIALFSILGISLYSSHIIYSIIATSETSFHFFLFLSLYGYELFRKKRRNYLLLLCGISSGLASMCRYEGLLIIPLFMFFLLKNKKDLIKFFVYAFSIPLVWMVANYFIYGKAWEFILTNNFIVPLQISWIRSQGFNIDFIYKLLFWPKTLIKTLGAGVFYLGIIGIFHCVLNRRIKLLSAVFVMFFTVFVINTLRETLYFQPRYGITLGLILIPFSIYCVGIIIDKVNSKIPKWIVLPLLWTMIIPIGTQVLASPLYAPAFAKRTALFLKGELADSGSVLLDHCGDEKYREPIKVLSRINPQRFVLVPKAFNVYGEYAVDYKQFFQDLIAENVKTLVYSPYGELKDVLNLNTEKNILQQRQGFLFRLIYKSDPYYIYSVSEMEQNE